MITPNPKYRPDPARSIYIDGELTSAMFSKLTPQIIKLQKTNRNPITVYVVDSPGGNTAILQSILNTLRLPDQDGGSPCHIITVVTSRAASCAADLISSGDYAIAYPGSSLLYHGTRIPGLVPALQPLTAERTSILSHILRLTNDTYAMDLVRKSERRFLLRFMMLRIRFQGVRDAHAPAAMSDLECFLTLLSPELSVKARKVLTKSKERYDRYAPLITKFLSKPNGKKKSHPAKDEAARLRSIVTFEFEANKGSDVWTFKDGGLSKVLEDFFLIAEYIENQRSDRLKTWCINVGRNSLSQADQDALDKIKDEQAKNEELFQKVKPIIQPIWMFFVALCHALQEDDNDITANDAYQFGLVDEVWGETTHITGR
ncbi:MAG: ATP-dependent Clp protease proteolytic subunit, partial [Candidatus Sulfotelmatobacter sp.]